MPDPSHAEYGAILARNVEMRARDGVRLATDVWRPGFNGEPVPGPFPAMLIRTPYNRTGDNYAREGEFWAAHGYLLVVQDVRGRWDSEGEFVLLANEGPDGYDAVEWTAELPYCDGNVGTYGTSYLAWVQSALAIERPPHLRAMWVNQGGANGHTNSLRHNGALELRWLTWGVTWGAVSPEARRSPALAAELQAQGVEMYEWLRRLPWSEGNSPLETLPGYNRWARELYENGDAGPYWQSTGRNFEAYFDISADVPTVYSGGWYDSYTRATTDSYVGLSQRLANQRLLMGPWTHGDAALERSNAGDVDLGPSAPIQGNLASSRRHLQLRWFDRWLKGVQAGVDDDAPVRIFVMGGGSGARTAEGRLLHGGQWRDEPGWPLERAVATPFYLRAGETLDQAPPGTGEAASSTFVYNPADPLPTISANTSSLNEFMPGPERVPAPASPTTLMRVMVVQGGADQRTRPDLSGGHAPYGPLEDRADVLAFSTEPLAADVEVTGPIEATLYLSSDAPDTDLFVMLQDVYPPSADWHDGYRLNIADGIMRVRYRDGMDRPAMMAPGEVYEVRFALYPTSNRFVAGHQIRVLVSSSSFPRFDVNPNTGEAIGRHTHTQRATNTIHHSPAHPSHVTLPLMPHG